MTTRNYQTPTEWAARMGGDYPRAMRMLTVEQTAALASALKADARCRALYESAEVVIDHTQDIIESMLTARREASSPTLPADVPPELVAGVVQ